MHYLHVCKKQLCTACNNMSCDCEWTMYAENEYITYHCPHCGALLQSSTSATSASIILNEVKKRPT